MLSRMRDRASRWGRELAYHLPLPVAVRLAPSPLQPIHLYLNRSEPATALEYLRVAAEHRPEIRCLLTVDEHLRSATVSGPSAVEAIPTEVFDTLMTCRLDDLHHSARAFNRLGCLRVGGMLRALLLLRLATGNIRGGRDHGWAHDAILLELGQNDYCAAFLERLAKSGDAAHGALKAQAQGTADWDMPRKLAACIDRSAEKSAGHPRSLSGARVRLQGPSQRDSDLAGEAVDMVFTIGYSGPQSLSTAITRAHGSFYRPYKLRAMRSRKQLGCLRELEIAVVTQKGWNLLPPEAFAGAGIVCSGVRQRFAFGFLNGGVEALVWVLGAGVSSVSVSHLDLFLNRAYPGGYLPSPFQTRGLRDDGATWQTQEWTTLAVFSDHEPSQQFAIFKSFRQHPQVRYDSVLDGIVAQPFSAYAEALENTYRMWPGDPGAGRAP